MRLLFVVIDFAKSEQHRFWYHEPTNDFWVSCKPIALKFSTEKLQESEKVKIDREEVQAQFILNRSSVTDKEIQFLRTLNFYTGVAIRAQFCLGLRQHERFGLIRAPYWLINVNTNQKVASYTYKVVGESQWQMKKFINVVCEKIQNKAQSVS